MPGGLDQADYDPDPFQSRRPFDDFHGRRTTTYCATTTSTIAAASRCRRITRTASAEATSRRSRRTRTAVTRTNSTPTRATTTCSRSNRAIRSCSTGVRSHTRSASAIATPARRCTSRRIATTSSRPIFTTRLTTAIPTDGPFVLSGNNTGSNEAHAVYIDDTINAGNRTITPGIRYERIDSEWEAHPSATVIVKGPTSRTKGLFQAAAGAQRDLSPERCAEALRQRRNFVRLAAVFPDRTERIRPTSSPRAEAGNGTHLRNRHALRHEGLGRRNLAVPDQLRQSCSWSASCRMFPTPTTAGPRWARPRTRAWRRPGTSTSGRSTTRWKA